MCEQIMNDVGDIQLLKKIHPKNINFIMAFRGWPDAKRVASYAAEYLCDKLSVEKIAEIDSRPFYDFAIQRPLVDIKKGIIKDYSPPSNELYFYRSKMSEHDLLILIGVEPHTNWQKYVASIFKTFSVESSNLICCLGGLIDRIPHTITPSFSGVATSQNIMNEMKVQDIEPADYNGPSSIHSLILHECKRRKIPAMSIWGHVPEYIAEVDPRTAHHLLSKVKALLGLEVDLKELEMEGNLFQKQLDSLMKKDQTFSQLVHELEIEYKNSKRSPDYLT